MHELGLVPICLVRPVRWVNQWSKPLIYIIILRIVSVVSLSVCLYVCLSVCMSVCSVVFNALIQFLLYCHKTSHVRLQAPNVMFTFKSPQLLDKRLVGRKI
jgi:hypothetical protein